MSTYIQNQVNEFLKDRIVDPVIVRNISCMKKITSLLPNTHEWYKKEKKRPKQFQYRSKNTFAFQKHGSSYVCIFGMYSQEYANCPTPNNGQVYISYLDSVNYFQPRELRSQLYQTIILAYIQYVKEMEYEKIYLWSCPPNVGTDYIFHRHPPNQRVPSQTHLNRWYTHIFDQGIESGIVLKYSDLYSTIQNLKNIREIPYFDGDFLPDVIENLLVKSKGRNLKEDELMDMLLKIIKKYKNNFFVININNERQLNVKNDPDPLSSCHILDNRGNFLQYTCSNSLEFSSLRRAKYSTSLVLSNINSGLSFICKMCNQASDNAFQCIDCIQKAR
jgi:E1A/CREB-binding protein